MANKLIRYPGRLGKTTPMSVSLAAMLRAKGNGNEYEQWLGDLQSELLIELLDYFKIDRNAPNAYFLLAYRLARNHVPAFSIAAWRKPGRPKKTMTIRSWFRNGRAGAPRVWTDKKYKGMLEAVREMANRKGYRGRGAISRALTDLIDDAAQKQGSARYAARKTELPHFRKRYSEAKRKFPELALK